MYLTLQLTKYLTLTFALNLNGPWTQQSGDDTQSRPPQLEQPVESTSPNKAEVKAETVSEESFGVIAGDVEATKSAIPDATDVDPVSKKLLNDQTPDWVKQGVVRGDDHSFAISSSLSPDLEQCREDLESRLLSEVQNYLDKNVLEHMPAFRLKELTEDYVKKYWLKKEQWFDNLQDRPSGTYHQLWVGLHISAEQLKMVSEWEKACLREERVQQAGVAGGIGVGVITLLSGLVGVFARREKAKLKS
jgi:hypothetical protein